MEPIVHLTSSCSVRGRKMRLELNDAAAAAVASQQMRAGGQRHVYAFVGIPYAEPPTGDRRFQPPQPATLWNGCKDATNYGATCPQDLAILDTYPVAVPVPQLISEDCLFLNIWTPTLDKTANLPVMLWIHGGGYLSGSGDMLEGDVLPTFNDVVMVTINYRLGAFGLLHLEGTSLTGNNAILDQIEALRWLRQHVSNFGGDPENMTVFGQSVGAISTSYLMVSPLARGLFRRAICESGTALLPGFAPSPTELSAIVETQLAKLPGCPDMSDKQEVARFLHSQPTDAIVSLGGVGSRWTPVLDGHVLPGSVSELYSAIRHAQQDLMIGCTSDEGLVMSKFVLPKSDVLERSVAQSVIENTCKLLPCVRGDDAEAVEQLGKAAVAEYLPEKTEDLFKSMVEYLGDAYFVANTVEVANLHSREHKTYLYSFHQRPSYMTAPQWAGADHGSEVFCVLGHWFKPGAPAATEEDFQLTLTMMRYWTNFAKAGDPNGPELETWPQYDGNTKHYVILKPTVTTGSHLKQQRMDFWLNKVPKMFTKE